MIKITKAIVAATLGLGLAIGGAAFSVSADTDGDHAEHGKSSKIDKGHEADDVTTPPVVTSPVVTPPVVTPPVVTPPVVTPPVVTPPVVAQMLARTRTSKAERTAYAAWLYAATVVTIAGIALSVTGWYRLRRLKAEEN